MGNYLSNYIFPGDFNMIGIFLTGRVKLHSLNLSGVDYYFSICIDSTIVSNDDASYCFYLCKIKRLELWKWVSDELSQEII